MHTHKPAYWISTVCLSTYQLFLTQTIEKRTFKQRLALAHDSSIHNNQRVKTTQIFDNRWQKEQDVYIQTTEYYPTLPWCADTSRSLPEWQETVTKDLVHHSTRQVCEEFFMEQQRTDRPALTLLLVHHVWGCLPCGSYGDEIQGPWGDRATLAPTWTEFTVHRANLGFSSQKVTRKEKGHEKPY